MKNIPVGVFLSIIIFSCSTPLNTRKQHVISMIDYLKSNNLDSAIFNQSFFSDRLKSKKNPYNLYYAGLKEIQNQLNDSDSYVIKIEDDKIQGETVFTLSTSSLKSEPIYFLVTDQGIESFVPLIKGDKIESWM